MTVGFDIISDLYLTPDESFNWEGKVTSLYCIIAGNISNDVRTIRQTLMHLSSMYQAIFYIPGSLEYENVDNVLTRYEEIYKICSSLDHVISLHNHVVIIENIALVAAVGWYGYTDDTGKKTLQTDAHRFSDISYLGTTIESLQLHLDVDKIVVITNSVPGKNMYFGEAPQSVEAHPEPRVALISDTEGKVSHWIFGTYDKTVDTEIGGINYINNSYYKRKPYWPKRIDI